MQSSSNASQALEHASKVVDGERVVVVPFSADVPPHVDFVNFFT
jgi:hypothetical protein